VGPIPAPCASKKLIYYFLIYDFFGDIEVFITMKKICIKCNTSKPLNDFSIKKANNDGHTNICKICHSKYRKEHYKKNKKIVYEQVYKYRNEHPEKYIKTFANRMPNKKAGRTIETKCCNPNCNIIVYTSKDNIKNKREIFCSRECKNHKVSPLKKYFNSLITRAKKKNIEYDLNFEFLKDLLENRQKNKCAITNAHICFSGETKLYETPSLDRIDNNKGYTKDNVQWVMLGINYMKMGFTNEDLHKTLKIIKENYNIL